MKNEIEEKLKECGAEIVDMRDKNFKENLLLALNTVGGCTDYRNDRERPYDGQPHTDFGIRGKTIVEGLTMRDISDCIVKGFLIAAGKHSILSMPLDEWEKNWNLSSGSDGEIVPKPNPEMLERIKKNEFVGDKVDLGLWRYSDLYLIEDDFDPIAVIQNTLCEIEKMMGIFPNVPKIDDYE